jgi:hypothetical protein
MLARHSLIFVDGGQAWYGKMETDKACIDDQSIFGHIINNQSRIKW